MIMIRQKQNKVGTSNGHTLYSLIVSNNLSRTTHYMCKISHQQCNELSTKWNGMCALVFTLNNFNLFN